MRHAKAEPFASTDHARVLIERGRAEASDAGSYLAGIGVVPDHAVVSTSARTRETWAVLAEAAGAEVEATYDDAVYHGGTDEALESLRAVPDDATTVIFVGHNPTASDLVHLLDDGKGDPDAVSGMLRGFPTSALVVFDVTGSWADLGVEGARVTAFHAPSR